MLSGKNRKKYIIIEFVGFLVIPIVMIPIFILLNYFWADPILPVSYYLYMFAISFALNIIIVSILLYLENNLLKDFKALDIDKKYSKLKIITYLSESFYFISLTSNIIIYNNVESCHTKGLNLFIFLFSFIVMLILSFLFGLFFNKSNFKRLNAEIERKDLFNKL